jgi:hypothetical protein
VGRGDRGVRGHARAGRSRASPSVVPPAPGPVQGAQPMRCLFSASPSGSRRSTGRSRSALS